MSMLKIALLQIAPCKSLDENLEKGITCCIKAKEKGADIALFPEMWSNGYNIYDRPVDEWKKEAVSMDSDFINTFRVLAKQLQMAIGITLLEKYENAPRNSLALFDRCGELKFVYAKVHTCDFGAERNLTAGEDFYAATLDTSCGKVKIGAMICYDREFPESARILMLMLMYSKEASNRKQEIDRQHHTIPKQRNQRPKNKHCGNVHNRLFRHG